MLLHGKFSIVAAEQRRHSGVARAVARAVASQFPLLPPVVEATGRASVVIGNLYSHSS